MTHWSKRLQQRLANSGGPPPPPPASAPAPQPIVYSCNLPPIQPPHAPPAPLAGPPVLLDQAVPGRQRLCPLGQPAFVVTSPASAIEGNWGQLSPAFAAALADPNHPLHRHIPGQCGPGPLAPEDIIFLDLETTGLNTGNVFLVGAMLWLDGQLTVEQFFARDYAQERAIVSLFHQAALGRKLLVTFNGKTFDLPYLRVRAAACRIPFEPAWGHLDLLHVSRKSWGRRFGDCKLQTLERHVCRRFRHDDIPGSAIPDAYHEFVRTGNAVHMVTVLHHNLLDLLTLAELMTRLPPPPPAGAPCHGEAPRSRA